MTIQPGDIVKPAFLRHSDLNDDPPTGVVVRTTQTQLMTGSYETVTVRWSDNCNNISSEETVHDPAELAIVSCRNERKGTKVDLRA